MLPTVFNHAAKHRFWLPIFEKSYMHTRGKKGDLQMLLKNCFSIYLVNHDAWIEKVKRIIQIQEQWDVSYISRITLLQIPTKR